MAISRPVVSMLTLQMYGPLIYKLSWEFADFFCQHPRWNLQFQGAPLSVYMRYSAHPNLTTYIISHREGDTSIKALHHLINIAVTTARPEKKASIFLNDPFDIAVILSTLSFEASKHHVQRFRRFMWTQVSLCLSHIPASVLGWHSWRSIK